MNREIGKKDFANEVTANMKLTLVQFTTEWNGACQIVSMIYDDLASSYNGTASFFTVNMERDKQLAKEFGVTDMPTILFFKSGRIVDHATGLIPRNTLISKIEIALNTAFK